VVVGRDQRQLARVVGSAWWERILCVQATYGAGHLNSRRSCDTESAYCMRYVHKTMSESDCRAVASARWAVQFRDGEWDIAEALLCVFRAFRAFRTSPANLGGRGAVQPPSLL
jgi:hypothetical protein